MICYRVVSLFSLLEKLTLPEQMEGWKGQRYLAHPVQVLYASYFSITTIVTHTFFFLSVFMKEMYFWASVLAVAAVTNFLDSQIRNQVIVNRDVRTEDERSNGYDLKERAARRERQKLQQFHGFIIAPKGGLLSNETQRTLEGDSKNALVCLLSTEAIRFIPHSVD